MNPLYMNIRLLLTKYHCPYLALYISSLIMKSLYCEQIFGPQGAHNK